MDLGSRSTSRGEVAQLLEWKRSTKGACVVLPDRTKQRRRTGRRGGEDPRKEAAHGGAELDLVAGNRAEAIGVWRGATCEGGCRPASSQRARCASLQAKSLAAGTTAGSTGMENDGVTAALGEGRCCCRWRQAPVGGRASGRWRIRRLLKPARTGEGASDPWQEVATVRSGGGDDDGEPRRRRSWGQG